MGSNRKTIYILAAVSVTAAVISLVVGIFIGRSLNRDSKFPEAGDNDVYQRWREAVDRDEDDGSLTGMINDEMNAEEIKSQLR